MSIFLIVLLVLLGYVCLLVAPVYQKAGYCWHCGRFQNNGNWGTPIVERGSETIILHELRNCGCLDEMTSEELGGVLVEVEAKEEKQKNQPRNNFGYSSFVSFSEAFK